MKSKIIPIHKQVIEPKHPEQRFDGWSNFITLLGTSQDKRMHSKLHWEQRTPDFFEEMYSGGGIPARIVDLVPEEALRHWLEWTNVDKKTAAMVQDRCDELDVRGALLKSWKWGRGFGGGICHIVTDTPDPASPLRIGEKVIGLRDLSRWDLRVLTTDVEFDFGSPNWGQPRIYYLNVQMGSQYKGYPIHWTRMLRFDGQLVPRRTYIRNDYWHDSILNRIFNEIRNYEMSNDAAASCLLDFNVDVYKMKNLANLIQNGKEDIVKDRVETINLVKSVINAMIIDADAEDYENKSRSLEGVAELLDKQANRLVAATDIPHTKLLGESPDGSNATGNSTSQQWYNFIATEQENYLRPKLKRLISLLFPEIPELDFKFKSLRVLDDLEKADMRLKIAQTDQIYVDSQIVDPKEIAMSRFGGDEYSIETKLDWEGRESGDIVPGSDELSPEGTMSGGQGENEEGGGSEQKEPFQTSGNKNEGNSDPSSSSGTGEGKPGEPEPGQDMRGKEGKSNLNLKGQPSEKKSDPKPKQDDEISSRVKMKTENPMQEGRGVEGLFKGLNNPGTEFDFRNQKHDIPGSVPKDETFISQTMSEPMRDPRTDPHIKGPGIPNKSQTFLPQRGNGLTAPSGFDFEKDAGKDGQAQRDPSRAVEGGSYYAYDSAESRQERMDWDAVCALKRMEIRKKANPTPNEIKWYNDGGADKLLMPRLDYITHEGSKWIVHAESGKHLGEYSSKEEAEKRLRQIEYFKHNDSERKRAATIIVRDGDKFLMGKRRDTGRWSLPGGHVEDKESTHQGGIRELSEETGLQAKRLKFLGTRLVEPEMNKPVEVTMYEHKHDGSKLSFKNDPDKEFDGFEWFSTKEPLPAEIVKSLAHPNNVALQHLGVIR